MLDKLPNDGRGNVYLKQSRNEAAVKELEKAIMLLIVNIKELPNLNSYRRRDLVYEKLGKKELAKIDLDKAKEIEEINRKIKF